MTIYFIAMLSYVFVAPLAMIIDRMLKNKHNQVLSLWFVLVFGILSSNRASSVGSDTNSYQLIFSQVGNNFSWSRVTQSKYPLYEIYNYLIYHLNTNQQVVTICNSFLIIILMTIGINMLTSHFYLASILYVTCYFFFQSMNLSRQFIAIGLLLIGVAYLLKENYKRYWILLTIACLFHTTALIGCVFYFLYDEFTIEVQQMIKKKTHSLSPCKI